MFGHVCAALVAALPGTREILRACVPGPFLRILSLFLLHPRPRPLASRPLLLIRLSSLLHSLARRPNDVLHSRFRRSLLRARHPGSSRRLHCRNPYHHSGTPGPLLAARRRPPYPILPSQCESVQLKWDSTGAQSYNVAIVPAANPCDEVV